MSPNFTGNQANNSHDQTIDLGATFRQIPNSLNFKNNSVK